MVLLYVLFFSLLFSPVAYADALTLPIIVPVEIVEDEDTQVQRQLDVSLAVESLLQEKAVAEATEQMRDYALYALFISVVSAVGLFFTLYWNGRAASAASQAATATLEANRIAREELRPWITLKRDLMCDIHFTDWGLYIVWNYNFCNMGKMPAYDVRLHYKAVKRQHLMGLGEEVADFAKSSVTKKDYFRTPIIFPGEMTDFLPYSEAGLSYLPRKEHIKTGRPMLLVCITYKLEQNGDNYGAEARIFGFDYSDERIGPFVTKMLEHSEARFIA